MFDPRPRLLVEISPALLTVRDLKTSNTVSEVPELAIGPGEKLLAAGTQARLAAASVPGAKLANPFAHPRSLVSDFTVGEVLLRMFVRRAKPHRWYSARPIVFMHPLGEPEGGLTQVERRALREMAIGAGASWVVLYEGDAPTDKEMLEMRVAIQSAGDCAGRDLHQPSGCNPSSRISFFHWLKSSLI